MSDPTCPYCGGKAVLRDSAVLYHGHSYGMAWICENWPECDAYVGCRRFRGNGDVPLGRLANAELREAKKRAHAAFDPIWRCHGRRARGVEYGWLAKQLGIPEDECHIGMFDVRQCERVCEVMQERDAIYRFDAATPAARLQEPRKEPGMDNETFVLTEEHVKLLRRANVSWWHCEFGAPCIDPKRPYGNGDVPVDMAEILGIGWKRDEDDDYITIALKERFEKLHKEMERALQVVLAAGSFEPGTYTTERNHYNGWQRTE